MFGYHVSKEALEEAIGKKLVNSKTFTGDPDTFRAYHDAERWAAEQGYSVGRMCSPSPTGIKKGNYDIAKWRNLSAADMTLMDGVIVGDNFRDGPVTVYYA